MPNIKRQKLIILHRKAKGRCYYCNRYTFIPNKDGTPPIYNTATIEHIYNKMDIRRFVDNKKVLSCYECNHTKAQVDFDNIFNNGIYKERYYKSREFGGIYGNLVLNLLKIKMLQNPE